MIKLPERPFTTKDFSLRGGGIDFLGLRWVNLNIVGTHLIPELNNVTADMGTFFLGAWIPWKFSKLCSNAGDYTEKNYKSFREKAEVAVSLTLRDEIDIARPSGTIRNRVGRTQKFLLPGKLNFKDADRTDQNSLYAAAIYGPSLRALGLIKTYLSQAREGERPLDIPIPQADPDTIEIVKGVDKSLKRAPAYESLASLTSPKFDAKDVASLAEAGLDPARYRAVAYRNLQEAFARKLLPKEPNDSGYPRTLTTRLVLATLRQRRNLSTDDMRNAWYAGMFDDGTPLRPLDPDLESQRLRWSCFMARQYQRYAIELFLWCFEEALNNGCRSLDEVLSHWERRTSAAGQKLTGTFQQLANDLAGPILKKDPLATSAAWNNTVHAADLRFEYKDTAQGDEAVLHGLRIFAGWYWRMLARQADPAAKTFLALGGADRMSMAWFLDWLGARKNRPLRDLLKDVFSNLVFAQHMRIALARFDGTAQRLRFLIGDAGIEPTVSARETLAQLDIPWMPDRLDTLTALLCDCGILTDNDGALSPGPAASAAK